MSKKWVVISQVALGSVLLATGYLVLQRRAARRAEGVIRRPDVVAQGEVAIHERAPLSLDLESLDLQTVDEMFDFEAESSIDLTVLPAEHIPARMSAEDGEAPAPEDLGERWLAQATGTESSDGSALYPNVEDLSAADQDATADEKDSLSAAESAVDSDEDSVIVDDDETTRDYIRKHRISSIG